MTVPNHQVPKIKVQPETDLGGDPRLNNKTDTLILATTNQPRPTPAIDVAGLQHKPSTGASKKSPTVIPSKGKKKKKQFSTPGNVRV